MVTSASETVTDAVAPPAETSVSASSEPHSIGLKIRTLDQKTYPITIGSDASVLQLKEVVAQETGVLLPRQRLIFRGKVLKDDQSISTYALEDEHVLHLVVRADPPANSPSTSSADANTTSGNGAGPNARNNDEPDPTVGGPARNRVVMGATISVPEGSDVFLPFLSSMVSNLVDSMGNATNGPAGSPGVTIGDLTSRRRRETREARHLRRRQREAQANTTAGGTAPSASRSPGREGSTVAPYGGGLMLREISESRLRRLEQALANTAYDFEGLTERHLQSRDAGDAALVQQHLTRLQDLVQRLGPRLQLLPIALEQIRSLGGRGEEAPNGLVSSTIGAIDTLQALGDAASASARFTRHVFLENSPDLPVPNFHFDNRGLFRASVTIPVMNPPPGVSATQPGNPTNQSETSQSSTTGASQGTQRSGPTGMLQALYERVTAGRNRALAATSDASSTSQGSSTSTTTTAGASEASSAPSRRVTFSTMSSGPFPPIFPFSSPVNAAGWDIPGFWRRLVSDMSASSAFGVLRGDPTSLHAVMAFIASILMRGTYMPPATHPSVRSWARHFLIELRRTLTEHGIPSAILDQTPDRDQSRFIEEITRPFDPFMPELVNNFYQANGASRGDAFGRTCAEFLRTMARQFVTRMEAYVGQGSDSLPSLLEAILVTLGADARLSGFVVQSFLDWAAPASSTSTTGARRQRDESEAPPSGAAAKRRRGE
ncbi:hypothetical protein Poli38472_000772 [Pythium oligandrum]|uniref:Ubiquitin-like domain-containing protein n=1 Tax=Pythium oligandrum TaxID=41045 RepID=A0A8K1CCQ8_PYTOL|nr:hypothetical protein Poli38472_000772 [Pythium oligandrum]|eukprot:TMW60730.1 hypothetical protein Poli38472_000772 [Pythium oligandrum]